MNILLVINTTLPTYAYGGTERVIWYLAKELNAMGHNVTFLSAPDTVCPFARCLVFRPDIHIDKQIPEDIDVIHFQNSSIGYSGKKPYIVTYHGNHLIDIDKNAVFVSRNHAERYNSTSYVYNGLDWSDYGKFNPSDTRSYFHFLGKAAWKVKNVKGAIKIINRLPHEHLYVLGGTRLNLKMGFRFTLSPRTRFKGMVGGVEKINYLQHSRGLIFPVRWHEPFGLAIIESLYCGAPVFGTTYGSLPELVTPEVGFLSNSMSEIVECIRDRYTFNPTICHEYAQDLFNSRLMAMRYVEKYDIVANRGSLNQQQPISLSDIGHGRPLLPFYE